MNNGKKEFPINGLEQDCTSKWGRKYYCFVNNIPKIKRYVKNSMNRRFRKDDNMIELVKEWNNSDELTDIISW